MLQLLLPAVYSMPQDRGMLWSISRCSQAFFVLFIV